MSNNSKNVEIPDITMENFPTKTRSAVLNKTFDLEVKETPLKNMGPRDVLIKVMAVGICGSDVHYYDTGHIGDFVVDSPLILGHESSGIIVATGNEVHNVKIGDRVAIEPGVPDIHSKEYREGHYNIDPNMQFMATPPFDGDLSELIVYPQDFVYKIPESMSYEIASLNEPFNVSLHVCQKMNVQPGTTVFISGMGPVGLLAILAFKKFGVERVIVSDGEDLRLETAKRFGADEIIDFRNEDVVEKIKSLTNQEGVDYVMEASGNPKAEQDGLHALRRGGKISYVGVPTTDAVPLDIPFMTDHEVQIFGIFRYLNTYDLGIKILDQHLDILDELLTDFYDLNHVTDAFEKARTDKSNTLKVIIYPNEKLQ